MDRKEFKQKPLRVHSFLAEVPIHSLDWVELTGGKAGMSLQEISEVIGFGGEAEMKVGLFTRALFGLRGWIGHLLGWDKAPELVAAVSYLPRLSQEDRARSRVTPGKAAGISQILYQFENEMLGEIVNRTVHCFWLLASEPTASGYRLWIAVYVKRLNWFTPIYMALISPLLKWVIYPAMQKSMKRGWEAAFPRLPQSQFEGGGFNGGYYDHTVK
jgi:hypothetical protein